MCGKLKLVGFVLYYSDVIEDDNCNRREMFCRMATRERYLKINNIVESLFISAR